MPRRIADYPDAFAGWNFVSSIGAYMSMVSLLVFFACVAHAFIKRKPAGANPWGLHADTLEWTVSSPPPFHSYEELPQIR
jgi:cytochrome c oxidase subunit 1